jgi:NAD(P)-dependent dehydrogenase (short-subunit alcohol dehydrogenase family)
LKEDNMPDKRIALVTGANQGVGLQVAKELVANGVTVLVGSRNFERGEAAAKEIGAGAIALQRVARLGPDGPSGTFTRWENVTIPW